MSKQYLCVSFNEKEKAKEMGCKFDWDKKLWYCSQKNKEQLFKIFEPYVEITELIGENRLFDGNDLFIDMIPHTSWFNNARSCIKHKKDWERLKNM